MIFSKYFFLAFALYILYKLMYPIVNRDTDVKYPDITLSLVGRKFTRDKLILYCANQMIKKGYDREEVLAFTERACSKKDRKQLLLFIGECFYIY